MGVSDTVLFFKQLRDSFDSIGAIFPTSGPAARVMLAEAERHQGPRRILEVGSGTGAVTQEIVRLLNPEDRLVICELNPRFVRYLEDRFEKEPEFARVRHQVEIKLMSITDLEGQGAFDYIISSLPFTQLPPELIEAIFQRYQELLTPSGVLSYIEYAYLRGLKSQLSSKEEARRRNAVLDHYIERFQFRREQVTANLPPVWVRSLRFGSASAEQALTISPIKDRRRMKLGPVALASDCAGLLLGLGAGALALKKLGSKAWPVPLALAGAAAWFHRDPERIINADAGLVLSACDGKVIKVDQVRHPRLGDQDWTRIAAFLSITDVHINRSPVAGRVVDTWEEPGGYSPAFTEGAEDNFSRYLVVEGPSGRCCIAQRSGVLARTIYTWPQKGELLSQGERFGLIRFGSRTDVYLPAERVEVLVAEGDQVIAGKTRLARYLEAEAEAS